MTLRSPDPIIVDEDEDRQLVWISVRPGASGKAAARALGRRLKMHPALGSYDMICDLREDREGLDNHDVESVAAVYAQIPRTAGIKYTCFITLDPYFGLWTRSMDHRFGDRLHKTFTDPDLALAFLATAPR